MKPITDEQIYEALVASEAHHLDGVMCTKENYEDFDMSEDACALCGLFGFSRTEKCSIKTGMPCILNSGLQLTPCCREFYKANDALMNNFPEFHTAELALYKRIRGLREEYKEKILNEYSSKTHEVSGKRSEPPKFAVGDSLKYVGNVKINGKALKDRECKIVTRFYEEHRYDVVFNGICNLFVNEYELSPLPEMYVGKEWILKQGGHVWNDRLVECVGQGNELGKYERIIHTGDSGKSIIHDNSYYPDGGEMSKKIGHNRYRIICIDPTFWTGEICGEKVRVYEDKDGKIIIEQKNGHSWHQSSCLMIITENVMLAAIKNANIPIMPQNQSGGKYPPPEGT